jgi:predicted TIM-barrel fold metal-dependent hydrolase
MSLDYQPFDREIWERDLEDFVPTRIWDIHTHLWCDDHAGSSVAQGLRMNMDFAGLQRWGQDLYPGREAHYLVLATPVVGMDAAGHNEWLGDQVAGDPASGANMAVTPDMSPEYIDSQVERHGFVGLKPYRTFAPDPADAAIRDFLPEALIEVAHARGLAVTLHLSKRAGPADFENLADLERYTRVYPGVRWILAHCARGFNETFLAESIHFLKELPGIWYDTSAVNDL